MCVCCFFLIMLSLFVVFFVCFVYPVLLGCEFGYLDRDAWRQKIDNVVDDLYGPLVT